MASWSESRRPVDASRESPHSPEGDVGRDERGGTVLSVTLDAHGAVCRLHLAGKLVRTSIAALEAQIDQLGCLAFERVVVDLVGLTGLDAVGANVLHGLQAYVHGRGGSLEVVGRARWLALLPELGVRD
jgi:ABC-type transporter Mla MlaB component